MTQDTSRLIKVIQKRGPTVNGKKPLIYASEETKKEILQATKNDYKKLLDLHFQAESGISDDRTFGKWKPLSNKYARFKTAAGLLDGILEAETPTLADRYKSGIKFNAKTFNINIPYPDLITGARDGTIVNAGIHQFGAPERKTPVVESNGKTSGGTPNGLPRRRITKKGFTDILKKNLREHFEIKE